MIVIKQKDMNGIKRGISKRMWRGVSEFRTKLRIEKRFKAFTFKHSKKERKRSDENLG